MKRKRKKTDTGELIARRNIPKNTYYCYTPISWSEDRMYYRVKVCPYYKYDKDSTLIGHCRLIKGEIWDMCKSCGINEN